MKICDQVKAIGDRVKVYPDDCPEGLVGIIGEISSDQFYVWQDTREGGGGKISPSTRGFKYSWAVNVKDKGQIELSGALVENKTETENKLKYVYKVLVFNRKTDEMILDEYIVAESDLSANMVVGAKFADKLRNMSELHVSIRQVASYNSVK